MGEQVITMPVVALRGLTILPGMVLHFDINRPKSVAAVERAMVRRPETVPCGPETS
ncbi:MAG: LON peptidase substrate-binding domain-containing protein [Enterocloster clostridioformis]